MPVGGIEYVSPLRNGVSGTQESREQRSSPSADKVDPPKPGVEVSISPEAMSRAQEGAENTPRADSMPKADLGLTHALGSMDLRQQEVGDLAATAEPQTRTTEPEVIADAAQGA